ncbi:MAG: ornithine cyclodeaminase family protein [Lachnospiraceae bacterium]|jgi:ornithine cyclodeaminase/alanine dehydrogenase-like protein (mu-crystallin family)|nr:ornithine cyclodeaminase family protein [Lachnospiraceae bacterium]
MKIVEEAKVRELVTPEECVKIMRQALSDLEKGRYDMPPRMVVTLPNTAVFGFMPAYVGDYFGAKVITAYGPNAGTGYPTHIGYVMLFEGEHCTVAGMVDATAVTELRTGAVSAVATDYLARKDAHTLGIVGAGAQARSHMAAIRTVRDIKSVRVYDIREEASRAFAEEISGKYGVPVTVCGSVREAVQEADIVCTLTPAKEAYLTRDMIRPGTHVNAVGTYTPTTREAASDLVAASRLYADQTTAMKAESGEYLIPLKEGLITEEHIVGSIGQVVNKEAPGRGSDEEITLFAALGLAVEDIACAKYVFLKAKESIS